MRVVKLPRGKYLYRRSKKAITHLRPTGFIWFALTERYGTDDTYGPIISTWRVQRRALRLLNISTTQDRLELAQQLGLSDSAARVGVLSCNEQYAGGAFNKRFHELIRSFLAENDLDGTYISASEADEDCEGATEVVIRMRPQVIPLIKKAS